MVFLKEFFEKVDFENNQQRTKKHEKDIYLINKTNTYSDEKKMFSSHIVDCHFLGYPVSTKPTN